MVKTVVKLWSNMTKMKHNEIRTTNYKTDIDKLLNNNGNVIYINKEA